MTQQRAFKQHVRERMARTGETYSTARRHVLARIALARIAREGTAAWPDGIVKGYDVCGGGTHHDTALLHNVLRAAGVSAPHTGEPWSEAMLVGLAGGIGFMYFVFEYEGHHPTMTIVARHHPEPYLPAALTRAGVPFTVAQTGSAKKATAALRAVLAAGQPAICTATRDGLPWHGVRGPLYSQDPYEVGVIGADGDTLYLDDDRVTPLAVPAEEFVAAWSAYRKGKHSLLTLDGPAKPVDLGAAVADAVATTCAHLAGPVLGNSFDVNFGFSGARKLAVQLRDPKGKEGWSRRYAHPEALFFGLRRLHDCLEWEYGGPGGLRPIYADFLDEAAAALDRPAYAEAATLFRRAGEQWSAVATAALSPKAPQLVAYGELVDERQRLLVTGEGDASALHRRVEELSVEFGAADPLDAAARRELLDALADGVTSAVELEERAVAVLTR